MFCIHSEGTKRCLFCHREIKDAESISRGIGSNCWEKFIDQVDIDLLVRPFWNRDEGYKALIGTDSITLKPVEKKVESLVVKRVDSDSVRLSVTMIYCCRCGFAETYWKVEERKDIYTKNIFNCRFPGCGLLSKYFLRLAA